MYDVGSYLEYAYGSENRAPYLYALNDVKGNYVTINYGDGSEYLFGGNPFTEEDEYLPERNAFNNKGESMLQALRFTQIRNAADSMILLRDADTGEVHMSEVLGEVEAAYYHVNQGAWQNPQYKLPLGLYLTGIPEGTRLELSLVSAPEYYSWYDAEEETRYTNWEALAEGAYLTTAFTIKSGCIKNNYTVLLCTDKVNFFAIYSNCFNSCFAIEFSITKEFSSTDFFE
jgi:hypothetical protein